MPATPRLFDPATYDAYGRTLTEKSVGLIHTNEYDKAGNRIAGTYADGRKVTTTYDALNRPEQILDDNGTAATTDDLTTRYGYDLAGRAFELRSPNGVIARNSYDGSGRLTHRKLYSSASQLSAGVPLATFVW
ncbi:MAG: RHS repeat domain-containing protein, partial [Prosthecobacter sp.]